jgi:hypothetical protein
VFLTQAERRVERYCAGTENIEVCGDCGCLPATLSGNGLRQSGINFFLSFCNAALKGRSSTSLPPSCGGGVEELGFSLASHGPGGGIEADSSCLASLARRNDKSQVYKCTNDESQMTNDKWSMSGCGTTYTVDRAAGLWLFLLILCWREERSRCWQWR